MISSLSACGSEGRRAPVLAVLVYGTCALFAGCANTDSSHSPGAEEPGQVQALDDAEPLDTLPVDEGPITFGDDWLAETAEALDYLLWEDPEFEATWYERLRRMQHARGDLPILLSDFTWTPLADAIVDEAEALPSHGVSMGVLPTGILEALRALRADLHQAPPLEGVPGPDAMRILTASRAEQALMHLVMILAHQLGATQPTPPHEPHGMAVDVADSLPAWRDEPAFLKTLAPPMHAYERLRVALARYEAIEQMGGFFELNRRVLKRSRPKRTHRTLGELRRRLAQEDPMVTPEGDTWDDDLTEALRRARSAYQLRRSKSRRYLIDNRLLKALAVPVEERIRKLKYNLQRWRASERRHYDYAIQVNLPDYHGEVWDGDERLRRFKIVIGNAREAAGVMPNATPTLSSAIRTVVFNPYWNVPRRILNEELVPQAHRALTREADKQEEAGEAVDRENLHSVDATAEYFTSNGYEILNKTKSGRLWIRQRPGPANALGKVKFLFDNRYAVFMHDTPSKAKFHFPRRAFSHGCMRVHKPIELAKLLLKRDGTWSRHREHVGLRTLKQLVIPVQRPIHLVVDYITNHVDDDGRVHWLHDVYNHDRIELASR